MMETPSKPETKATEIVFGEEEALTITGEVPTATVSDPDTVSLSLEPQTFFKPPSPMVFSPVDDPDTLINSLQRSSRFFGEAPLPRLGVASFEESFLKRSYQQSNYRLVPEFLEPTSQAVADAATEAAAEAVADAAEDGACYFLPPPADSSSATEEVATAAPAPEAVAEEPIIVVAAPAEEPEVAEAVEATAEPAAEKKIAYTAVVVTDEPAAEPKASGEIDFETIAFVSDAGELTASQPVSTTTTGTPSSSVSSLEESVDPVASANGEAVAVTTTQKPNRKSDNQAASEGATNTSATQDSVAATTTRISKPAPGAKDEPKSVKPDTASYIVANGAAPSVTTTSAATGQAAQAQPRRDSLLADTKNDGEVAAQISGKLFTASSPDFGANPGDHQDGQSQAGLIAEAQAAADEAQNTSAAEEIFLPEIPFTPSDAYVA